MEKTPSGEPKNVNDCPVCGKRFKRLKRHYAASPKCRPDGMSAPVPKPKPKNIGYKMKTCPKCQRNIKEDRFEHHLTTRYCAIKARSLAKQEKVRKAEENAKAREQAASLEGFRCVFCHRNNRTEGARLKHEAKCAKNPDRKKVNATMWDTSLKKKSTDELTEEEASAVIAGEATPIEKKAVPCPDEDSCKNKGTDMCFDCKRLVPMAEKDSYYERKLDPEVCGKCGKTIYGPMEHHLQKCKGVPVVEAKGTDVKPFNVSSIEEPVVEPKTPLKPKRPDKDARHCEACGLVIEGEGSSRYCEKCKRANKKSPGTKAPKIAAAKRGA